MKIRYQKGGGGMDKLEMNIHGVTPGCKKARMGAVYTGCKLDDPDMETARETQDCVVSFRVNLFLFGFLR